MHLKLCLGHRSILEEYQVKWPLAALLSHFIWLWKLLWEQYNSLEATTPHKKTSTTVKMAFVRTRPRRPAEVKMLSHPSGQGTNIEEHIAIEVVLLTIRQTNFLPPNCTHTAKNQKACGSDVCIQNSWFLWAQIVVFVTLTRTFACVKAACPAHVLATVLLGSSQKW